MANFVSVKNYKINRGKGEFLNALVIDTDKISYLKLYSIRGGDFYFVYDFNQVRIGIVDSNGYNTITQDIDTITLSPYKIVSGTAVQTNDELTVMTNYFKMFRPVNLNNGKGKIETYYRAYDQNRNQVMIITTQDVVFLGGIVTYHNVTNFKANKNEAVAIETLLVYMEGFIKSFMTTQLTFKLKEQEFFTAYNDNNVPMFMVDKETYGELIK